MKRKRRILSLLLTVIMCLSVWSVPVFAKDISYDMEISAGDSVKISGGKTIKFTPEFSGTYYFYSETTRGVNGGYADPGCTLYHGTSYVGAWDDYKALYELELDNYDFCVKKTFTAGEDYYFNVRNYGSAEVWFYLTGENMITHQPSAKEPYVETLSDENVTCQWYKLVTYQAVEITTESAVGITGGNVVENAAYDSQNGWSPAVQSRTTSDDRTLYSYGCFETELDAGDTMKIVLEGGIVGGDGIYLYWMEGDEYIYDPFMDPSEGIYEITVESAGTYGLVFDSETTGIKVRAYLTEGVYEPAEGETECTLKNLEIGQGYYCQADFKDGTSQKSKEFTYGYYFNHQPVAKEPYVEGNFSAEEGVKYQWYSETPGSRSELTPDVVEHTVGNYTEDDGWSGVTGTAWYDESHYYYEPFKMELSAGTRITVEMDGTAEWFVGFYESDLYNDFAVVPSGKADEIYEIEIKADGQYAFYYYGATDDVKAKVYIQEYVPEELEGENEYILKNPVIGTYYHCDVMTSAGSLMSESFKYDYAITHQPTLEDRSVALNEAEGVSYQWYQLDLSSAEELTGENAAATAFFSGGQTGYYEDGTGWHGAKEGSISGGAEYYYGYFYVELKAGQTLLVATDGNTAGTAGLYKDDSSRNAAVVSMNSTENAFYRLTVIEDGTYCLYLYGDDEDITVRAWLSDSGFEAVQGETSDELSETEVDKFYYCEVTTEDQRSYKSSWFTKENVLTHHPVMGESYVSVNEKDNVKSYQWYRGTVTGDEIKATPAAVTGSAATTGSAAGKAPGYTEEYGWIAEWDDEKEQYNKDYAYFGEFLEVDLSTGESITIVADGTISGELGMWGYDAAGMYCLYDKGISGETDGAYTFTAGNAATYTVYMYSKTTDVAIRLYRSPMEYSPVEGQNSLRLTGFEEGYYRCDVEFTSGKTLTSRTAYLEETWQTGDINRDEYVTAEDALEVLKYVAHMTELDEEQTILSDVNFDGNVTAEDALLVLKYVANMIDKFE